MAESVELATILLTDLVGSTRLATSVGPTRADELREEHFALLREAIAVHEGREGKNTGDGLMIAFGSASAAVRCAVLMQQLFERRYRDAEQALHIRIGLGAGESTVKDGDYFGMPSIEAARLCEKAPADGILASAAVRMLAGHVDGAQFESGGEIELKGFPDPVPAFAVSWAALVEEEAATDWAAWPLPPLLRSVPAVSYVGRVGERAALEGALTQARGGERQIVLLSGEPGIGKSRLAGYSAHRAHAQGFAVLWGTCSEELAVPYEPWIEACSQLVEHASQQLLADHEENHGGELGRLAHNMRRRLPDLPAPRPSDPETERYLLFSAVAGLLGELAASVPVCLVLDDMHWADAQSIALLKHLARTAEQHALLIIVAYRDSDIGKDHPLSAVLADLRRVEGAQRIALQGLAADEVAEVMAAVAGHELAPQGLDLAAQIAEESNGNPFFVGEILRALSESGALAFDEETGRWSIDHADAIALPESVREVIERRVERLGEQSLEALRLAALIGREFDLRVLATALGADESRLLDHLEAAASASVLAESAEQVGRFRFVHGLINQTLYEGLGATRRAQMHGRVAQALEQLYGADPGTHLAELALHWRLAAVSVDRAKAADYALKAGQLALESLAPAEAVKLFADAVELTDEVESRERCEALLGLGEAQRQTGDGAFRETLLEASRLASVLEDADFAARAALANSRGFASVIGGLDKERLAAIERALELDNPPQAARRARLLALNCLELSWDSAFDQRVALAEQAVSVARETEPRTLAEVLLIMREPLRSPSTLDMRLSHTDEAMQCAAQLGDPALEYSVCSCDFQANVEAGNFERAAAARERADLIARELDATRQWSAMFSAASWKLMSGDFVAGERLSHRAMQLGRELEQFDVLQIYGAQMTFLRRCQGRAAEIVEASEQSTASYPNIAAWRAGLPWLLCAVDRGDEARALLEQAASDGLEQLTEMQTGTTALALYADVAVETGSADAARILYRLMEPWADQFVFTGSCGYGYMRMWLGLLAGVLGEHEEADRQLASAREFCEGNGLRVWSARTHLGWAQALAQRGDAAGAREHATQALELSREHGYGLFEKRASALLSAQPATNA